MITFEYIITDKEGIHARPAGQLIREAKKYASSVTIRCKDKTADAKRLLAVMSLAAKCGDTVTVNCEGADEEVAAVNLKAFLQANL